MIIQVFLLSTIAFCVEGGNPFQDPRQRFTPPLLNDRHEVGSGGLFNDTHGYGFGAGNGISSGWTQQRQPLFGGGWPSSQTQPQQPFLTNLSGGPATPLFGQQPSFYQNAPWNGPVNQQPNWWPQQQPWESSWRGPSSIVGGGGVASLSQPSAQPLFPNAPWNQQPLYGGSQPGLFGQNQPFMQTNQPNLWANQPRGSLLDHPQQHQAPLLSNMNNGNYGNNNYGSIREKLVLQPYKLKRHRHGSHVDITTLHDRDILAHD